MARGKWRFRDPGGATCQSGPPSFACVLAAARTFTLDGVAARPVRVEADVHRGLPAFTVVGLPDTAVREARERVRAALVNCGYEFPLQRITINLAPASLRKAGPGLDLAIAAALLCASGQVEPGRLAGLALAGELALDGAVRPIPGVLAMAEAAWRDGCEGVMVPARNGAEAALVGDIEVVAVEGLGQLGEFASGEWRPGRPAPLDLGPPASDGGPDLADLRGQPALRHALEVTAAGGHSLMMIGPPGAGKSLAARRLPSILPPLGREDRLEVARIASACGRDLGGLNGARPFRAPHHTISSAGLIGGGNPPRAGEVTLAHRGVLFLDELCEFSRDALEALREPLEAGTVSLARSGVQRSLPCRFMLVAAANPCPCGRGEDDPRCGCPPHDIARYGARLSGALADRIDIVAPVAQPGAAEINGPAGEASAVVRARVREARVRQEERLGAGRCNADMTPAEAREQPLSSEAAELLQSAYEARRLSGRTHDRTLRLARTEADLRGAAEIGLSEMGAALALRRRDAE